MWQILVTQQQRKKGAVTCKKGIFWGKKSPKVIILLGFFFCF
jgi:hypothetical protein